MEPKEKEQNLEEGLEELTPEPKEKPKSKFNPKVLIIGLPIFVVQLIVVYFITANILMKKMDGRTAENVKANSETESVEEVDEATDTANIHFGEHIFQIEDIIVNPANTQGEQLLLSSVAFDVPEEAIQKELEKKQILVKDMIISVLASKTIGQLSNVSYKDSLRVEISDKVQNMFSDIKINRVYFSKYIIN
jgi:flagellar FliL protein